MNSPETSTSLRHFCLILAQTFLPPAKGQITSVMRADLVQYLAALAEQDAIAISSHVAALDITLSKFGDDESLLIHYSRLFLVPPIRAHLNLGCYLDGSINGPALDAIEYLRGKYGISTSATFRDLPDHLASLLEFQAILFDLAKANADRVQLAQRFLIPGLSRLIQIIAEESEIDSPYLHLARITETVLLHAFPIDDTERDDSRQKRSRARQDLDKGVWRNCIFCKKPYAREKEIQIMEKAMQLQNLPTEHLSRCPECRTVSQAWLENSVSQD